MKSLPKSVFAEPHEAFDAWIKLDAEFERDRDAVADIARRSNAMDAELEAVRQKVFEGPSVGSIEAYAAARRRVADFKQCFSECSSGLSYMQYRAIDDASAQEALIRALVELQKRVSRLADKLSAEEQARAEKAGLEYTTPSAAIEKLRQAAQLLIDHRQQVDNRTGASSTRISELWARFAPWFEQLKS